jgi:hypothetical protein
MVEKGTFHQNKQPDVLTICHFFSKPDHFHRTIADQNDLPASEKVASIVVQPRGKTGLSLFCHRKRGMKPMQLIAQTKKRSNCL